MLKSMFSFLASAVLLVFVSTVFGQEYEFIVVGSGPGGGPLAANLARAGHSVLLLEAGTDQGNNPNVSLVANYGLTASDPKTRWDFFVKHSSNPARELQYEHLTWRKTDGSFYVGLNPPAGATQLGIWYPRAATLGGCATHNAAVAMLPSKSNWDQIAELTGDESWTADSMRQYLVKLEKNLYLPNGTAGHGFNGYLAINQDSTSWTSGDSDQKILGQHAAVAFGEEPSQLQGLLQRDINSDDPNRDRSTGIYGFSNHADNQGNRYSPIQYIHATLSDAQQYNLTVHFNSLVSRILFENSTSGAGPTACGVEYLQGESVYSADPRHDTTSQGTTARVYASKEVIIAGGTFNSPQLLKLSGIGPANELTKLGIPLVKDSPGVGINLGDSYESGIVSLASRPLTSITGNVPFFLQSATAAAEEGNGEQRDTLM